MKNNNDFAIQLTCMETTIEVLDRLDKCGVKWVCGERPKEYTDYNMEEGILVIHDDGRMQTYGHPTNCNADEFLDKPINYILMEINKL